MEINENYNYKIYEDIDSQKNLTTLIKDNIINFKNPSNDKEFIENVIILDHIISEKYKIPTPIDREIFLNNPMNELLVFFKNQKYNVFIDYSIDDELYSHLLKYYFNKNTYNKKVRIHLDIDIDIIKNLGKDKLTKIYNKIVDAISDITKFPKENLYVTNNRKGSWICDLFYTTFYLPFKFNKPDIDRLQNVLDDILRDLRNNTTHQNINIADRIRIIDNLRNFAIRPTDAISNIRELFYDPRYNKKRGEFGIAYWLNIFKYHIKFKEKNRRNYYYPNNSDKWEGFGLKIHDNYQIGETHFSKTDIFNSDGNWYNAYANLPLRRISYKTDDLRDSNLVFDEIVDGKRKLFSLIWQCRIHRNYIRNNDESDIRLSDNRFIIRYRLLKEHIDD